MTILTVEPGDIFGWSAIVPPHRATSTAVAIEPVERHRPSTATRAPGGPAPTTPARGRASTRGSSRRSPAGSTRRASSCSTCSASREEHRAVVTDPDGRSRARRRVGFLARADLEPADRRCSARTADGHRPDGRRRRRSSTTRSGRVDDLPAGVRRRAGAGPLPAGRATADRRVFDYASARQPGSAGRSRRSIPLNGRPRATARQSTFEPADRDAAATRLPGRARLRARGARASRTGVLRRARHRRGLRGATARQPSSSRSSAPTAAGTCFCTSMGTGPEVAAATTWR